MNHEPVLFASTMYETANEAFLFCKEYLEKSDPRSAEMLEGIAPINVPVLGRLALRALQNLRTQANEETRVYVDIAINSMSRALGETPLSAVA